MGLTRLIALATVVGTVGLVMWATYSALFGGYPWLAILPVLFLPAIWYIVRSEGGPSRMAARWLADEERSWRNPNSLNQRWFGPRLTVLGGAGAVAVYSSWPDPVSRWILTFALAALAVGLARIELRGLRGTRDHEIDVLHVVGDPDTYVAVCRTCDWVGEPEAALHAATTDAAAHGPTITRFVDVRSTPHQRRGRYTRPELRRLWNDATNDGVPFAPP
jgi:hypothetical protein